MAVLLAVALAGVSFTVLTLAVAWSIVRQQPRFVHVFWRSGVHIEWDRREDP